MICSSWLVHGTLPLCVVEDRAYYHGGLRRQRRDAPLGVGHTFRCLDGARGGLGQITALWTCAGRVFIEYQSFVECKVLKHLKRPYWGSHAVVGVVGRVLVAHPQDVMGDAGACVHARMRVNVLVSLLTPPYDAVTIEPLEQYRKRETFDNTTFYVADVVDSTMRHIVDPPLPPTVHQLIVQHGATQRASVPACVSSPLYCARYSRSMQAG